MTNGLRILAACYISLTAHADSFSGQIFDSARAYGRSETEAAIATADIHTNSELQIYLTLSTPSYYSSNKEALEAAHGLRDGLSFQIYLTLRTPSYHLSHSQSMEAAETLQSISAFQTYLHLLVVGMDPSSALKQAASLY